MNVTNKTMTNPYDALKNTNNVSTNLSKSMERLTSKLNAGRGAGGTDSLTISNSLRTQVQQLATERNNAQDGVAATQVATNSLEKVGDILRDLRKLAESSEGNTPLSEPNAGVKSETNANLSYMDVVLNNSIYNGKRQFSGVDSDPSGKGEGSGTNLNLGKISVETLGLDKLDLTTQSKQEALSAIDSAIEKVSATLKNVSNQRDGFTKILQTPADNPASKIKDVDMASEMATLVKNQILKKSDTAVLAQANQTPQNVLSLLK